GYKWCPRKRREPGRSACPVMLEDLAWLCGKGTGPVVRSTQRAFRQPDPPPLHIEQSFQSWSLPESLPAGLVPALTDGEWGFDRTAEPAACCERPPLLLSSTSEASGLYRLCR